MRTFLSFIFIMLLSTVCMAQEAGFSISLATTTVTLTDCLKTAQDTYEPLKLSKQEIELSSTKVSESRRSLYPTLTGKAEQTNGAAVENTGTPAFREQTYGVQTTYPLYEGGRLTSTLKQSKSNLAISNLKYEKTKKELTYTVSEAYWNLARLISNIKEYQKNFIEVKKTYDMAKKLYDNGSINEREILLVEAQLNQATYQLDSNMSDLENQKWKLSDAMGINKPIDFVPIAEIPFNRIEISMEECLKTAETNNYDILIGKETAEANRHGMIIKNSYKKPKVDLNGFYGRSGGAFESEDLKLTEDYQIGVQIAQPIHINTFNLSGSKQKTSPKLGQSSRTEADTVSASFNVLDAYRQKAEEKEAALSYKQAVFNLQKAKSTAAAEVREAYFNYKKALSQVKNAELDYQLANKELAIDRINLGNDKANFANVSEDSNKLVSATAALTDAKTFYLISIAALNKAVGVEDKFQVK